MFPVDFVAMDRGTTFHIVAKVIFFDSSHEAHVLQECATGRRFGYKGLLELGYQHHTLLNAVFLKQYPFPKVAADGHTKVLNHEVPSWHSLKNVIDVCSGIGALSEGVLAAGFDPILSVDVNPKMTDLCAGTASWDCITGDIGDTETVHEIWTKARYAKTMTAGFSCQPFPSLEMAWVGMTHDRPVLPRFCRRLTSFRHRSWFSSVCSLQHPMSLFRVKSRNFSS